MKPNSVFKLVKSAVGIFMLALVLPIWVVAWVSGFFWSAASNAFEAGDDARREFARWFTKGTPSENEA